MSEQHQPRWHWLMAGSDLYGCYQRCLALCRTGDGLLLMGRHICLLADTRLQNPPVNIKIYALKEDIAMAGLKADVPPYVQIVDWNQVLNVLLQQYPLQQTWA